MEKWYKQALARAGTAAAGPSPAMTYEAAELRVCSLEGRPPTMHGTGHGQSRAAAIVIAFCNVCAAFLSRRRKDGYAGSTWAIFTAAQTTRLPT